MPRGSVFSGRTILSIMRKAGMHMELKQVWMSADTARKSRFGLRTLGGIAAIAALMLLLIGGGLTLSFALDLPREVVSLLLVCAVTALAVTLAVRLGWRSVQDATVFFLTEDDRLFVLDARMLSRLGRGVLGYAAGAMETQELLRELARRPRLPAEADEIRKVAGIRENGAYHAVRCQVRRPGCRTVPRTYFLVKGIPDEEALLRQLERRQSWETALEPADSKSLLRILVSTLVLAVFTALCVLSHPAVGKLPQSIYFPCLGAAFLTVCFLVTFIVLHRRGQ